MRLCGLQSLSTAGEISNIRGSFPDRKSAAKYRMHTAQTYILSSATKSVNFLKQVLHRLIFTSWHKRLKTSILGTTAGTTLPAQESKPLCMFLWDTSLAPDLLHASKVLCRLILFIMEAVSMLVGPHT